MSNIWTGDLIFSSHIGRLGRCPSSAVGSISIVKALSPSALFSFLRWARIAIAFFQVCSHFHRKRYEMSAMLNRILPRVPRKKLRLDKIVSQRSAPPANRHLLFESSDEDETNAERASSEITGGNELVVVDPGPAAMDSPSPAAKTLDYPAPAANFLDYPAESRPGPVTREKSLSLVARNVLMIANDDGHDWLSKFDALEAWCGLVTEDDVIHVMEKVTTPRMASRIFKWVAHQTDFQHTVFTYNAYLNALVKAGQGIKARKVFGDMLYEECFPNVYTYGIVLRGLCEASKTEMALELVQDMESKLLTPTSFILNMLISHLCKNGRVAAAYDYYKKMSDEYTPDRIAYNMLTYGLCKADQVDRALVVFSEMQENEVAPSLLTYNGLLYGYCRDDRMEEAMKLLTEMMDGKKGSHVVPDIFSYNTVINGFCKSKRLQNARYVLRRMIKSGCAPDAVTYNTLIDGLCLSGKLDEANAVFDNMLERGLEPTAVTYTVLITGHAKALRIDKANDYFVDMLRRGVEPNVYTYTALIGGLCDANKVDDAAEILRRMFTTGREPNVITYTRVMSALVRSGQIDRATTMFNDAMGSKTSKCKPDAFAFNTIIYGLCKVNRILEAYEYFLRMVDAKIVSEHYLYKAMADGLELIQENEKLARVHAEANSHGIDIRQKETRPRPPNCTRRKHRKEDFLWAWETTRIQEKLL